MMEGYKKPSVKNPSTEFSDEFVDIVKEINDFISVLEVRQKELAAGTPKSEPQGSRRDSLERLSALDCYKTDSGTEFFSDSRTESSVGGDSWTKSDCHSASVSRGSSRTSSLSDLGKALEDHPRVLENEYEPIANIFQARVTATATASVIQVSDSPRLSETPPPVQVLKPDLPPKPPGLQIMGEPGQPPRRVKALHTFRGTNNDELCFTKGDIITVTQAIEGGWWEGTLLGKTGWFPSNYVREFKQELTGSLKGGPGAMVTVKAQDVPKNFRESMQYYHNVVLQNVIETERAHVAEMTSILQTYIRPINNAEILSTTEFSDLTGNLEDIITFQQNFLVSLEECSKHPAHQRRVGGVFMRHAPSLKELYTRYCANHPRAVAILQKNKDELGSYMEKLGASAPGSMTLTTMLSKPFTRLDKYPSLLKELERHIEESHVDRGDTQRAITVYRDISNHCMDVRKLKEMEYDILTSNIKDWEGDDVAALGDVKHLSQVKIETANEEKFDRIFILFPNVLLMLTMSPRLSGYQYEGKIPLSGISVSPCESEDNDQDLYQFEISGNMIEKMTVTCGTKAEVNAWLDALKNHIVPNPSNSSKPVSLQVSTSQPSISTLTPAKTAKVSVTHTLSNFTMSKTWTMSCLRPAPPIRPPLLYREDGMRSPRAGRKLGRRKPERTHSQDEYDKRFKKYDPRTNSEDALILKVIEAYNTSAKTRHTVNSYGKSADISIKDQLEPPYKKALLSSPNLLIPQDEKIIVDDGTGTDTLQENRNVPARRTEEVRIPVPANIGVDSKPWVGTLVDTVYSLRDQVKCLEMDQKKLRLDLEEETKARKSIEHLLKKLIKGPASLHNTSSVSSAKEIEENHT